MHAILAATLALAGLSLAQMPNAITDAIKEIPECAIACLSGGSAVATECGIADAYCQCTKGAPSIKKFTQKCLCDAAASGKCTPDDLMKANKASADICVAALAAKGETFSAPPAVDASACEGAMPPMMSSSMMSTMAPMSTSCTSEKSTMAVMPSPPPTMPGMNMTSIGPYGGSNLTMTMTNETMSSSTMMMTGSPTITATEIPSGTASSTAPAQQTAGARAAAAVGDSFAILVSLGMLGMAGVALAAM